MIEIRKPDAALARILPPVSLRSDIDYVPSQYVLSFAAGDKRYVFNNLTKQCIEGTLPATARVGEGYDELICAQFLVPSDKDECAYYNEISALMRAFNRKKGIKSYTILPTFRCNARCTYCYEEGVTQTTMTPETVEQVIRFIVSTHAGKKAKITWFGGEPLLGEGIIDRICEGLREAGVEYKSTIISNGSLISPEIISKMVREWKTYKIQITMDGAEEDYIPRKHYYVDRDYYHRVMESVSQLSEAGISVNIRCNVDEDNWSRIPQFLNDLKAGVAHKENINLYFALLNASRMSENDVIMWRKIKDARPLIEEAGFRSSSSKGGVRLKFRNNYCMADGGGVVITPDGTLAACEHCPKESQFGDIWHGTTDEEAKKEFCRADRTREKCRTCPFLPDCTSFASCPLYNTHCRQVNEMLAMDSLKRMVEHREENSGDDSAC